MTEIQELQYELKTAREILDRIQKNTTKFQILLLSESEEEIETDTEEDAISR